MMAGTTLGKGNIVKLMKGKFGLILVDRKTGRAARVVPKGDILLKVLDGEFMQMRKAGTLPQDVPWDVARPLIEKVLEMEPEKQFNVEIWEGVTVKTPKHLYEKGLCEECGEVVVGKYAVEKEGRYLCPDCANGSCSGVLFDDGEILVRKKV